MAFFKRKKSSAAPPVNSAAALAKSKELVQIAGDVDQLSRLGALLAEPGIDVNFQDENGNSALHKMSAGKRLDAAYLLLTSQADPSLQNLFGESPLMIAANFQRSEMLGVLLQALSSRVPKDTLLLALDSKDRNGNTALMHAAKHGSVDMCVKLLNAGASPSAKNNKEETPLMLGATSGSLPVCELLIQKKASVDSVDQSGSSALQMAAASGRLEVVNLLLRNGASLEAKDNMGRTPLMVSSAHPAVTQRLEKAAQEPQPPRESKSSPSSPQQPHPPQEPRAGRAEGRRANHGSSVVMRRGGEKDFSASLLSAFSSPDSKKASPEEPSRPKLEEVAAAAKSKLKGGKSEGFDAISFLKDVHSKAAANPNASFLLVCFLLGLFFYLVL